MPLKRFPATLEIAAWKWKTSVPEDVEGAQSIRKCEHPPPRRRHQGPAPDPSPAFLPCGSLWVLVVVPGLVGIPHVFLSVFPLPSPRRCFVACKLLHLLFSFGPLCGCNADFPGYLWRIAKDEMLSVLLCGFFVLNPELGIPFAVFFLGPFFQREELWKDDSALKVVCFGYLAVFCTALSFFALTKSLPRGHHICRVFFFRCFWQTIFGRKCFCSVVVVVGWFLGSVFAKLQRPNICWDSPHGSKARPLQLRRSYNSSLSAEKFYYSDSSSRPHNNRHYNLSRASRHYEHATLLFTGGTATSDTVDLINHYQVLVPTTCTCCTPRKPDYLSLLSSMVLRRLSMNGLSSSTIMTSHSSWILHYSPTKRSAWMR